MNNETPHTPTPQEELCQLRDALGHSPDFPLADLLKSIKYRNEARAKLGKDNAALVAALEDIMKSYYKAPNGIAFARRFTDYHADQARAALDTAKQ